MGHRSLSRPVAFVLVVIVTVGAAACSSSEPSGVERERAAATLERALQAHGGGNLGEAERLYLETLRLDPQNVYAYYNLGVIAQTEDDADAAIASYRDALEIDPDFVPALFNLAILRTEEGDGKDAADLYKHIIKVAPDNAAAHLNLGFLLIDLGREERGRRELDEAVAIDPSLADRIGDEGGGGSDREPATGATGAT